ncbi:MAG: type IV secretion system protein TraC [Rhodanobacter sp.]
MDYMRILDKLTRPILSAVNAVIGGNTLIPNYEIEVLPDWLQAIGYYEDDDFFYCASGALGFGFIGPPLSGVDPKLLDKLQSVLQEKIPKDSIVQFALWASPDMEQAMVRFRMDRPTHNKPVLRAMREERVAFLRSGADASIVDGSDIRLRDVRLVITVKVPTGPVPTDDQLLLMRDLRDRFDTGLKTCGFGMEKLSAPRYLRFMQTIFNWKADSLWRQVPTTEYVPDHLLTEQILDPDVDVHTDADGLEFGTHRKGPSDCYVRLLSPKRYPKTAQFGNAYNYLGDALTGTRGLRDPVLITVNMLFGDAEADAAAINKSAVFVTNQSGHKVTKFKPEILEQKRSHDLMQQAIKEGDRVVRAYLGMAIFAKTEEKVDAAAQAAKVYMREFGFQMMQDRFFTAELFSNLLPFACDAAGAPALRRYRRWATRHIATMLPMFSEWRGTGSPALMLASRNGQLMTLSNWDSETNYNVVIAAESGSGKSFLMNDIAISELQRGGRMWIVDKGKSYRNLCDYVDGERLEFGKDSSLCLNPFTLVEDYDDDADVLYGLVSAMAAINSPLTDFQAARLKEHMRQQFMVYRKDMLIDHLADAMLQDMNEHVKEVGFQLFAFTSRGEYGRWFNGRNNYRADNPFVLLELDELDGRAQLQRVVLLQLMFQIQREMNRGDRSIRKILAIDEAWELLKGNEIAPFIEAAYRKFRKYGGAAFTITQSVEDFFTSDSTRAIYLNSAHKWVLGQRSETIAAIERDKRLEVGEHGYRLLKTVKTVRGQYSEIFAHTPYGYGVGRLVVPEVTRILYSTTPADVQAMDNLRKQGKTSIEAAQHLLNEQRSRKRAVADQRYIA